MSELTSRFVTLRSYFQTAPGQFKFRQALWVLWFLLMTGVSVLVGMLIYEGTDIRTVIAWMLMVACAAVTFWKPRWGLYLLVFLSLMGDRSRTFWYPYVTNMSSPESILFLNDSLIFSPFELFLVLTYFSWFLGAIAQRSLNFRKNELLLPVMVFLLFMVFGLVYGLATGGNSNMALWEFRPIVYLPAMYLLTSSLITRREHVNMLVWLIMTSLFIKGVTGVIYVATVLDWDFSSVQQITEHSAAVHFNTVFIYLLGVWIFKDTPAKRFLLPVMALPVLFSYIATQRRAAYLVLIIALVLIALVLYREKRALFWSVVPAAALVFMAYLAVFWNNQGALGMPARAVKSQLFPSLSSARDQSSDVYRMMENYNSLSTIWRVPLTGTGFGHPFDMVVQLPDISFFVWYRYITHNTILWIWMNTGIGGFLAMLVMVGSGISVGARTLFRLSEPSLKTAAFLATFYLVMHFIFAYVDISWDNQNMIYVGTMLGLIGCLEAVAAQPQKQHPQRWPWQSMMPRQNLKEAES